MAYQEPPSFEDLEPEDEDLEISDDCCGHAADFEEDDDYIFSEDALDEAEFTVQNDFEAFNSDSTAGEFTETRPDKQHRENKKTNSTARNGQKRIHQRTVSPDKRVNGHKQPAAAKRFRSSAPPLETAYLDELEAALDDIDSVDGTEDVEAWSATLWEDYELMEILATAAAKARSRTDAEGLAAALVPLSLRLAPHTYRALWPVLPALIRVVVKVVRQFHRQPATRQSIELLPFILENTITQLARHATYDQPVTQRLASRIFTRQTAMILDQRPKRTPAAVRPQGRSNRSASNREWWNNDYDL